MKFDTSGRSKPLGARWQWLWSNVCDKLLVGDPSSTWPLSSLFPLYHYPLFPLYPFIPFSIPSPPFLFPFFPSPLRFLPLIHHVPRRYDDPRARYANDCGRGVTVAEPRPRNEKGRWQCQCKSVIRKHPRCLLWLTHPSDYANGGGGQSELSYINILTAVTRTRTRAIRVIRIVVRVTVSPRRGTIGVIIRIAILW